MGVILQELVDLVQYMDMKLVAGEAGLSNEVRWTHMVDSDSISAFLEGQELAFTTGLGLNEHLSLLQLVRDVHRNKASGIVINIGPYVSEIPQEVIDFANEYSFPVFEVPWEVHMAEIMRIFCFAITKAEQQEIELSVAFHNAFCFPKQEEMYMATFMQKGYLVDWSYNIVIINMNVNGVIASKEEHKKLQNKIALHIKYHQNQIISAIYEDEIIMLVRRKEEEDFEEIKRGICYFISQNMPKGHTFYMGIGMTVTGLKKIHVSYQQAKMISLVGNKFGMSGEHSMEAGKICDYREIGLWKLLFTMDDKAIIKQYVEDTVATLYEYDKLKQSDLVEVIATYLKVNGSIKDTADELMMHRNTVIYKIHKAEELMGKDMSEINTRIEVTLGFALHQLMKLKK